MHRTPQNAHSNIIYFMRKMIEIYRVTIKLKSHKNRKNRIKKLEKQRNYKF